MNNKMVTVDYEIPADIARDLLEVRAFNREGKPVSRNVAHYHSWQTQKVGVNAKGDPVYDLARIRDKVTGQLELFTADYCLHGGTTTDPNNPDLNWKIKDANGKTKLVPVIVVC